MLALEECHAKGFIHKALGRCNDQKRAVNACFAEERKAKTKAHRQVAMEKRRKHEEVWKEIDRNS
jgi:COX assembly protein 2